MVCRVAEGEQVHDIQMIYVDRNIEVEWVREKWLWLMPYVSKLISTASDFFAH
jgi:hypothetical protein